MMKRVILTTLAAVTGIYAGAYKVPEQSLHAMALGAAYIAHTEGADSAYYNPANMAFMPDKHYIDAALHVVYLPENDFEGVQILQGNAIDATASSEHEWAAFPTFHYVHTANGPWRWGISVTAPDGLTKRWKSPVQKLYAEKFRLLTVEVNPSLSYRFSDTLAMAVGIRGVYSEGEVYSDGNDIGVPLKREMSGDTVEFGWNIALAWRPMPDVEVGVTYRSKIDLNEEGDANLYLGRAANRYGASVSVPMPAALNIAVAKTFDEVWTVEAVYERTFWSSYESLDFEYDTPVALALVPYFDDPKAKNWDDTDTFRLGVTYRWDEKLTLMGGYAYDPTPVPEATLSYELPDSDAHIFSAGFTYRQNAQWMWGAALLYDYKTSRDVYQEEGIQGEFSGGGAVLATIGVSYEF